MVARPPDCFEKAGRQIEKEANLRQITEIEIAQIRAWRTKQSHNFMLERAWEAEKVMNERILGNIHDGYVDEIKQTLVQRGIDPNFETVLAVGVAFTEADEGALELYKHNQQPPEVPEIESCASTPIVLHVDKWLLETYTNGKTRADYHGVIKGFGLWASEYHKLSSVESISRSVAGKFISSEAMVLHKKTVKKKVSALAGYWNWQRSKHDLSIKNVWKDQPYPHAIQSNAGKGFEGEDLPSKRPFTDNELSLLLNGIMAQPLADMIRISALSGMAGNEIVSLKVCDCQNDTMTIRKASAKNKFRVRHVPIHPDLVVIINNRCDGKDGQGFLFGEIPEPASDKRNRFAAKGQEFTRKRRQLGVDDHPKHLKKSRIDFHSLRRWFTAKAQEVMENGVEGGKAAGFTRWTIDDVTGHKRDEKDMTMGLYAGVSSLEAMRACVDAVKLPITKTNDSI